MLNWVTYLSPMVDFHNLSHFVILWVAGSTISPSNIFSIEGPLSWTNLIDSESRLSRFSKAITSFRCSCTCKFTKQEKQIRKRQVEFSWKALRKILKEHCKNTHRLTWMIMTINRKEDLQCSTKTKNLKLSPETTFLTAYTVHQCTAIYRCNK